MKKNLPCRYGQFYRFGVKIFLVILWFQMLQNGPSTTKTCRFIENFRFDVKKICHASQIFRFGVTNFPMILWFRMIQTDYWRNFVSADWVYNQIFLIYWEFYEVGFLVRNWKKLSCRYGQIFRFRVKKFPVILWFQMIQNRLLSADWVSNF